MSKRNLTISLIVTLLIAVGGFFAFRQFASAQTSPATSTAATSTVKRGSLVASVSAAGTLAAPQSATLTWGLPGSVGAVHVTVGQVVTAGAVLMELNPASLSSSALQARANLVTAQETLDTLLAGPTPQQIATAKQAVVTAQTAITTAQTSLNNVLHPNVAYYQDQLNRAQQAFTAAQQNAQVDSYQVGLRSAADAVTSTLKTLQYYQGLEGQYPGYSQRHGNALINAQTAYDNAVLNLQTAQYKAQQAQASAGNTITDAQSALATAQANLTTAQQPDPAKVVQAQAALNLAKASLTQAQTDLATLLASPDPRDVAIARANLAAAQINVNLPRLTAPFTGTVIAVYNQPGDLVSAGTTAVAIADLSHLLVNLDVSEIDINRISVGQEADLTLDAAPGKTFQGKVTDVGTLGKTTSGVVTFPVKVVVPQPDKALKPGMTAAVSLVTDKRSNVLVVPNRALRTASGQRSVTVVFQGEQFVVPVTVGLVGDTQTEITGGQLKEGDTILSSAASATTTTNRGGGGLGFLFGGGGFRGGP